MNVLCLAHYISHLGFLGMILPHNVMPHCCCLHTLVIHMTFHSNAFMENSKFCIVLCAAVNTYRVRYNTTCCLLVCSEWPPVANPIFTTATPISRWMVDCIACTCQTTSLTLPWPPSVHSVLDDTSPLGLYSLYSLLFMMSFARALLPCFSLLHALRHCEAVAACSVSQKSRCTQVYGRIV